MIQRQGNVFIIENDFLRRELEIGDFGLRTVSFKNLKKACECLHLPCREFAFSVDRNYVNSVQKAQYQAVDGTILKSEHSLEFIGDSQPECGPDAEELCLTFRLSEVDVTVHYRIYKNIAGMRKWLSFKARKEEVLLENIVFDDTLLVPGGIPSKCDFFQSNSFWPAPVSFTVEGTEDLVACWNEEMQLGVLTATTAPGPLRYILCYPEWNNMMNACSMSLAPFAKYIKLGETWSSPASLIAFGEGGVSSGKFSEDMRSLIRKGLPTFRGKENVMFCTWMGYQTNVSEKLMFDLADCASKLGIGCVVLDMGWYTSGYANGVHDRLPIKEKFPRGLEVVSDYLHSKNIAFGLWVSIGHDGGAPLPNGDFEAIQADGTSKRLGWNYQTASHTQCFASGYRDVMLKQADEIATKYKVDYFKFDASSILSPYAVLPLGCHSHKHEHHHGFADSVPEMFAGLYYLREELVKRHPGLLVDFSFECFGTERPTIAALEYSDINHLTNDAATSTKIHDIWRIRRNFYRHIGALPPERLLHGLIALRPDDAEEVLLTSFIGAPLISGDILKLTENNYSRMKKYISAFNSAVDKGPLTSYEMLSDTPDFDAFRRYSPSGAEILCAFNRTDKPISIGRQDLLDAETGSIQDIVPPKACRMFWKKGI